MYIYIYIYVYIYVYLYIYKHTYIYTHLFEHADADTVTNVRMSTAAQKEIVRSALTDAPAILAPLTRGGNLPFRVLCAELCQKLGGGGAQLPTVSEMVYAKFLLKGDLHVYTCIHIFTN